MDVTPYKRTFIIVGITIIVFLFIANCKNNIIRVLGGYTEQDFITKVDTTYLPVKIDTVEVFNAYVQTRGIILNPEPIIKYKYKTIIEKDTVVIDSTKYFNVSVNDTLITGNIHIFNDYQGNLLDAYLNYRPLFPKYIEITKPIKITETKYVNTQKILLGIGGRFNSLGHLGGHLGLMTRDRWDFRVGYNSGTIIDNAFNTDDYISLEITKYFKW